MSYFRFSICKNKLENCNGRGPASHIAIAHALQLLECGEMLWAVWAGVVHLGRETGHQEYRPCLCHSPVFCYQK